MKKVKDSVLETQMIISQFMIHCVQKGYCAAQRRFPQLFCPFLWLESPLLEPTSFLKLSHLRDAMNPHLHYISRDTFYVVE
jgi:hypothetical protein